MNQFLNLPPVPMRSGLAEHLHVCFDPKVMNNLVPSEFYLSQNYPNPFSRTTKIKFCVAVKIRAKLEVFDSEGKMVGTLLDEMKEAGTYEIEFDASNLPASLPSAKPGQDGRQSLSGGTYLFKLEAGDYRGERKMILSK
jgi:hypothetical protein